MEACSEFVAASFGMDGRDAGTADARLAARMTGFRDAVLLS